jgi:hypothetical protein
MTAIIRSCDRLGVWYSSRIGDTVHVEAALGVYLIVRIEKGVSGIIPSKCVDIKNQGKPGTSIDIRSFYGSKFGRKKIVFKRKGRHV